MRAALVLISALAGCGPAVLGIQVQLVIKTCAGTPAALNPTAGITRLRVKLTGEGLTPQTTTVDYQSGTAQLPNIPVGTGRRGSTLRTPRKMPEKVSAPPARLPR